MAKLDHITPLRIPRNQSHIPHLAGLKFKKLQVLGIAGSHNHQTYWLCLCDCGNVTFVPTAEITCKKATQSCGCIAGKTTIHGYAKTKVYRAWLGIKWRCNPRSPDYPMYGGRGITVCERWLKFENFLVDMGKPPSKQHSIDRIDNNGNYCPENCKWSTPQQQARNRRSSKRITFKDQSLTLAEWGALTGIHPDTLSYRLLNGWSADQALTIPASSTNRIS